MREWFETRLFLPFLPLAFDVLLRSLALKSLAWWQIPDLKTLSITTSFFCLLLAMDLKSANKLPGDVEHQNLLTSIRKRFLFQSQISAIIFGATAAIDVADRYHNSEMLSLLINQYLVFIVSLVLILSIVEAILANYRYKLSYNG